MLYHKQVVAKDNERTMITEQWNNLERFQRESERTATNVATLKQ